MPMTMNVGQSHKLDSRFQMHLGFSSKILGKWFGKAIWDEQTIKVKMSFAVSVVFFEHFSGVL